MAELRTEEEQLEAIKRWWKENGTSLIAGVVIAIAGVLGWNAWQDYQANQAEAASLRYQELLALAGQQTLEEDALARAQQLVGELADEHGNTLYADLAALIQARLSIADGDRESAMTALEALIASTDRDYLKGLAHLRLARLQLAAGEAETALATLETDTPDALGIQRADTRGDILVALGRDDEARDAYQRALRLSREAGQPAYGLQLKLDNLGAENATL
ncbi:Putative negative regulator of RcsB-dependent stress response [Modicisalibacter ilicicola DSM 19980]|uniref:Ancillary SecYEG translocon subunit n=1 Tax=Modicisalibacter ilicicola DSM 19980 TaxID=1121942 RepID=A0A1M4T9N4_9GAMM|nr:tetratricopeptide repeat protein [Halomonas ilicicola]SHE41216.1 Putative negative regulator of RcsB-dependent stress response [Halomonas ilicicola DSM 19980]